MDTNGSDFSTVQPSNYRGATGEARREYRIFLHGRLPDLDDAVAGGEDQRLQPGVYVQLTQDADHAQHLHDLGRGEEGLPRPQAPHGVDDLAYRGGLVEHS